MANRNFGAHDRLTLLSGIVKPKRFKLTRPVELIDIGPILVEPVTCVRRAWDLLSGSEAGRVETSLTNGNVPHGRQRPPMPMYGCDLAPSLDHGVGVPVGHLPFAALAAINLGCPQGETARLTVHGGRGVLQAGGIGHITHHVIRLQFERVRGAVGELLSRKVKASVHIGSGY